MSRLRVVCILPVAALALALPCCRKEPQPAPVKTKVKVDTSRVESLPNIIWLTVDTLRADHTGFYNYARKTMPSLADFAETAAVFDSAVVPRGYTRPSYASMLTGLYPYHHGVRCNDTELHENLTTLPEILKAAGYHTVGFVGNFNMTGEFSGMNQGFDVYDDRCEVRPDKRSNYERDATGMLDAMLAWLDSDPPQPFFLFTNWMDPHGPYHPPEGFRKLYRSKKTRMLKPNKIPRYLRVKDQNNFYDYVDRYDAEIRFADEAMGMLIERLKKRGLWDNAFVVFTSDHGESLGEHDIFFEHRYQLWEETVRVPLAIRLPRSDAASRPTTAKTRRIGSLASTLDLAPTVLDYLKIKADVQFDGQSLLPAMAGARDWDRTLWIEYPTSMDIPNPPSSPDVFAVRTATHKLIRLFDQKTGKLAGEAVFDVIADPLEQHPIRVSAEAALHRTLAARFGEMFSRARSYVLPFQVTIYTIPIKEFRNFQKRRHEEGGPVYKQLSPEQAERLRGLGYVQ